MPDFPLVGTFVSIEGSKVMDGSEQTIIENIPSINRVYYVMGFIDLSPMTSGDVIVVRQYVKLSSDKPFRKYAEEVYSGVQALSALHILSTPYKYGIKVTVQQMEGVYRTLQYLFFIYARGWSL